MNENKYDDEIEDIFDDDQEQPVEMMESVSPEQPVEMMESVSPEQPVEMMESVNSEQPVEMMEPVSPEQQISNVEPLPDYDDLNENPDAKIELQKSEETTNQINNEKIEKVKLTDNKTLMFVLIIGLILLAAIIIIPNLLF